MTIAAAGLVDHAWWLGSRSAGILAYALLSLSVVLGIAMATRSAPTKFRPALRTAHARIALIALAALAAHGLMLLGDAWLHPGVAGILVPFALDYQPFWTGIGICAGYLTIALSLSYYVRRWVGPRRWRSAHRLIPVAWLMATGHVLGAGSDAGALWLQVPLAATVGSVALMLAYRWTGSRAPRPATPGHPSRPAPPARPMRPARSTR